MHQCAVQNVTLYASFRNIRLVWRVLNLDFLVWFAWWGWHVTVRGRVWCVRRVLPGRLCGRSKEADEVVQKAANAFIASISHLTAVACSLGV
jgi:hypothetical protein